MRGRAVHSAPVSRSEVTCTDRVARRLTAGAARDSSATLGSMTARQGCRVRRYCRRATADTHETNTEERHRQIEQENVWGAAAGRALKRTEERQMVAHRGRHLPLSSRGITITCKPPRIADDSHEPLNRSSALGGEASHVVTWRRDGCAGERRRAPEREFRASLGAGRGSGVADSRRTLVPSDSTARQSRLQFLTTGDAVTRRAADFGLSRPRAHTAHRAHRRCGRALTIDATRHGAGFAICRSRRVRPCQTSLAPARVRAQSWVDD
jgi:hypothetical protein